MDTTGPAAQVAFGQLADGEGTGSVRIKEFYEDKSFSLYLVIRKINYCVTKSYDHSFGYIYKYLFYIMKPDRNALSKWTLYECVSIRTAA